MTDTAKRDSLVAEMMPRVRGITSHFLRRFCLASIVDREDAEAITALAIVEAATECASGEAVGEFGAIAWTRVLSAFGNVSTRARRKKRTAHVVGLGEDYDAIGANGTAGRRDYCTPVKLLAMAEDISAAADGIASGRIHFPGGHNPWGTRGELASMVATLHIPVRVAPQALAPLPSPERRAKAAEVERARYQTKRESVIDRMRAYRAENRERINRERRERRMAARMTADVGGGAIVNRAEVVAG